VTPLEIAGSAKKERTLDDPSHIGHSLTTLLHLNVNGAIIEVLELIVTPQIVLSTIYSFVFVLF
jgi:hypothetical protein